MSKVRLFDVFDPSLERYAAFFPEPLLAELKSLVDYRTVPHPKRAFVDTPEYQEELYNAEILLTGWGTPLLPVDLAEKGKVKYICHVTGALRGMVPKELLEAGIKVTNWGSSISRTIAEASLMMILGCLRKVKPIQDIIHLQGGYRPTGLKVQSLFERKVGLFGLGAIARDLVALLKPFNVEIYAYSPHVPQEIMDSLGVKRVTSLRELFTTCDIISVHAARTPANMGAVNAELLQLLPDDGILVNTSRGAVINEAALIAEVQKGRLWVALDVYDKEPLPVDSPLRGSPRVLLFPHVAGPTMDRYVDATRHALDNIRRYLAGEPLVAQVTAAQYDLIT